MRGTSRGSAIGHLELCKFRCGHVRCYEHPCAPGDRCVRAEDLMITRSPNQKGRETGRQLAVVTGASTGIGYELARCCGAAGYDLVIAADEPQIRSAAEILEAIGVEVTAVETDLSTLEGVDELCTAFAGRRVDALLA